MYGSVLILSGDIWGATSPPSPPSGGRGLGPAQGRIQVGEGVGGGGARGGLINIYLSFFNKTGRKINKFIVSKSKTNWLNFYFMLLL